MASASPRCPPSSKEHDTLQRFVAGQFSLPQLYKPHITPPLVSACHFALYNLKALQLGSKNMTRVMGGDEWYWRGGGGPDKPLFSTAQIASYTPMRLSAQDYNLVGVQKMICKTHIWQRVFTTMTPLACTYQNSAIEIAEIPRRKLRTGYLNCCIIRKQQQREMVSPCIHCEVTSWPTSIQSVRNPYSLGLQISHF